MQTFSIMLNTEKWTNGNLSIQNTIYTDLDEERKFYLKTKNKKTVTIYLKFPVKLIFQVWWKRKNKN